MLTFCHKQLAVMPVGTEQVFAVLYDNKPAIADKSTAGIHNRAIAGGIYRLIGVPANLDAPFAAGF